jgi:hypothetical protein
MVLLILILLRSFLKLNQSLSLLFGPRATLPKVACLVLLLAIGTTKRVIQPVLGLESDRTTTMTGSQMRQGALATKRDGYSYRARHGVVTAPGNTVLPGFLRVIPHDNG